MEEQSDTPYYLSSCSPYSETAAANPMRAYSKKDCAEIIAHEGGTAYVLAEDYERALATATRERDEARADLDRFRHTAKRYRYLASWCSVMSADIDGNHYWVSRISSARLRGASFEEAVDKAMERDHWERSALAATEAARKFCGVGELERTGYIPAGSADEREAKP